MIMKKTLQAVTLSMFFFASSASLQAKVDSNEAEKLDTTLTPLGAIRSGNSEGTIPEWRGGITQPPQNYEKGKHHSDPYVEDKPLYTITKENLDKYKDRLSEGQIAMFEKYPGSWKMDVYPTRRSASFPKFVYKALKENARNAVIVEGGNGVFNAGVSSPFPIPKTGAEAVWNHLLRYRGEKFTRVVGQAAPTASGSYNLVDIEETVLVPYNQEGATVEKVNNRLAYFLQKVKAPAYLAGNILLVHDTLDQNKEPRSAWTYNPGQRRVRRAPNIAFDNPGTASDGQRTTDQADIYNGSPERYNWKLIGRKEMIVPYNSYKIHGDNIMADDVIRPGHINPELTRYELHRVWEVEGSVKESTSHIYAKRRFFLDEDSWQILLADHYDARGQIWRVTEAHCINYYEVPLFWSTLQVHYDLMNGRYLVFGLNNEKRLENFSASLKEEDFTPSNLRRLGKR